MKILLTIIIILTLNYQKGNAQNIRQMNISINDSIIPDYNTKHSVYGNIGWGYVIGNISINYEYKIFYNKSFVNSFSLKASAGLWAVWSIYGRHISISTVAIFNRLEFGVGIVKLDNMDSPIGFSNRMYLPMSNLGFRYSNPKNGFLFRTGVSYPQGIYASLGYSF
ncbi:MAG: hypothetical protein KAG84_04985 [Bacteroidales bacterium]|nr:hypothetical protein [Bacteroidales bacterium]